MKLKTVKSVYEESNRLQETILFSGNKKDITEAFAKLQCMITGKCICESCPEWEKDTMVVYEFGRCIIPTRFLQMIKELHYESPRWSYIQPLYRDLIGLLYEDLSPDAPVYSNGDLENQRCKFKMTASLREKASKELQKLQTQKIENMKTLRKMQCENVMLK